MKKSFKLSAILIMVLLMFTFKDVSAQSHTNPRVAFPIELNQDYTRYLTKENYRNNYYVEFDVPTSGIVSLTVSRPTDSSGTEVGLSLEMVNQEFITVLDVDSSDYNPLKENVTYSIGLPEGKYSLNMKLRGYVISGLIPFEYRVAFEATEYAEKEPNQGITTATNLTINNVYQGFYNDREDYYRINSQNNRVVSFLLDRDSYLSYENENISRIETIDANGVKDDLWFGSSLTTWKMTADGKYFSTDLKLEKGDNYIIFGRGLDKENGYSFKIINNQTGWVKESDKWYFYDDSSILHKGWLNLSGKWYYLDDRTGIMQSGWSKANTYDDWYLLNSSGVMQIGWQKVGNSWYFMNNNGTMKKGWMKQSGKWYLLDKNTGAMKKGWSQENPYTWADWYYMNSSGQMQTGWNKVGKHWYYMDSSGKMQTDFLKLGSKKYYLASKTGAMQTDWFKDTNYWYYANGSGIIKTGWFKQKGYWYYLDPNSNGTMETGWTYIDGKQYTFDSKGRLQ